MGVQAIQSRLIISVKKRGSTRALASGQTSSVVCGGNRIIVETWKLPSDQELAVQINIPRSTRPLCPFFIKHPPIFFSLVSGPP
jgi:hypothetical protein